MLSRSAINKTARAVIPTRTRITAFLEWAGNLKTPNFIAEIVRTTNGTTITQSVNVMLIG
ncbi:MAG: hypothetical protein DHS20C12_13170 [Pseudohongiella sp.]|nr:MAG: hypothetical protein DHS20C12_13170 [Pseudohongiella sp.]